MQEILTKQDVIRKKMKSIFKILLKSYKERIKDKTILGIEDKDILNYLQFASIFNDLDTMANFYYEAFLDIKNLSNQEFNECLSEELFNLGDLKGVSKYDSFIKILIVNALTRNENGNIYEQLVIKMKNQGISPLEVYQLILLDLPPVKRAYFELIQSEDFDFNKLEEGLLEILNKYHKSFMDREILPHITKTEDSKKSAQASAKLLNKFPNMNVDICMIKDQPKKL